ncbi:hypothetical protein C5142_17140 [Rhodococcus sp. BGS-1C]|jgi:hypothetical protein|uniref:hypothetical protein n=1 Tax=unclassified Rhodococcus (in: high G+C Gram-positive bacteria) TaxID=192944 RepID=UPI00095C09D8|nr:hypothetical protein [Rhodococcus sp. KRD197]OLT35496.1 hypothetical protein BJF84_14340 [Rhodococcus sp. CUA-806]
MATKATVGVLRSLGRKIAGEKPDLRPATGVVNDVGRSLAASSSAELRTLQAEVASLREQLETCKDVDELKPAEILRGQHGRIFLAGAMWGADEIISSYLTGIGHASGERGSKTILATVSDLTLHLLRRGANTPSAIREFVEGEGFEVRPDHVSKALGDLMARGLVSAADAPAGSDRRARFYQLS